MKKFLVIVLAVVFSGCFGLQKNKEDCTQFNTAPQITDNIGTDVVDCFLPMNISEHRIWCLYLKNIGENNLLDATVFVSPNGEKDTWAPLMWTSCDQAAPGITCLYKEENSVWNYVKATCAALDHERTRISVWYSGNTCCK